MNEDHLQIIQDKLNAPAIIDEEAEADKALLESLDRNKPWENPRSNESIASSGDKDPEVQLKPSEAGAQVGPENKGKPKNEGGKAKKVSGGGGGKKFRIVAQPRQKATEGVKRQRRTLKKQPVMESQSEAVPEAEMDRELEGALAPVPKKKPRPSSTAMEIA